MVGYFVQQYGRRVDARDPQKRGHTKKGSGSFWAKRGRRELSSVRLAVPASRSAAILHQKAKRGQKGDGGN